MVPAVVAGTARGRGGDDPGPRRSFLPEPVHDPPVEIAGQVAALDLAASGRAYLGLSAGAWLDQLGLEQPRPRRTIAEAWEIVSRRLAGDRSGFDGEVFSLAPGSRLAYQPQRRKVPLLVGTWSPGLTAFAAGRADELKLGGSAYPALVRLTRERLGDGAVGVVAGAVTVVDRDDDRARSWARREVAPYVAVVATVDPTFDLDPECVDRIKERLAAGDVDGAAWLVSDDMLDRYALAGTPLGIAEQAEALFDAGAKRVEFGTPHGIDERAGVELLVGEVAPRLRGV